MHYYQFNIADYRKDTSHLSRLEHSIYRDLIDWYYLDEHPIPKETQVVSRRLRLVSEEEEKALKNVLSDFFTDGDGWVHGRIESDIREFRAKSEKNRLNGKLGGRPKKTQVVSERIANDNHLATQVKGNQEPLTNMFTTSNDVVVDSKLPTCPQQEILKLYEEILPELPQPRMWDGSRATALTARWRAVLKLLKNEGKTDSARTDDGLDYFSKVFLLVKKSDFLMGRKTEWTASLGWIVKAENFAKIIDGNYDQ